MDPQVTFKAVLMPVDMTYLKTEQLKFPRLFLKISTKNTRDYIFFPAQITVTQAGFAFHLILILQNTLF